MARADEFATVSGFTQTVGNVGGLVAASPLALLVEAMGWRQSFVVIGIVTLALGALPLVAIHDRPEAAGLPPVTIAIRAPRASPSRSRCEVGRGAARMRR